MKFSTRSFTGAVIAAACLLFAFTSFAQVTGSPIPEPGFAGAGSGSTTLSYFVCSANSTFRGPAMPTFISATSDKAASVVKFYTTATPTSCNYTNSTVTIPVASTNGFNTSSGIIIIRHVATDVYERRILTASTGSTNLVTTVAPGSEVDPGDLIYPATAAGTIPCGAATLTVNAPGGAYVGETDKNNNPYPLLLEVDGTSACSLNTVSGTYLH